MRCVLLVSCAFCVWQSSKVVIGDLGCVQMADPHMRLRKKLRQTTFIHVCTPNYKPPDVWLGSQQYQEDLDMWSFGCVAAEVYSGQILIATAATAKQAPPPWLEAIAAIVPALRNESGQSCSASWLEELPLFKKWIGCSGYAWLKARAATAHPWPPSVARRLHRRLRPAYP